MLTTVMPSSSSSFAIALVGSFVTCLLLGSVVLRRPEPARDPKTLRALDPVGGNRLKRLVARGMTMIAQLKESRKSRTPREVLEAWHKPEDHPFFNESYYFNGCDLATRDRLITRISHRGNKGMRSYVFLLLDLADKDMGILSLETDVPAESDSNPQAVGLSYHCVVPMKVWRIRYNGPMTRGLVHPRADRSANAKVQVELDLEYVAETDEFWYMRDDHPSCLAGNLSQEPWGMDFLRVCLKRTVDHAHYEDFGRLRGKITVNGSVARTYDFGTFRDHSWDIRRWATMDNLFILLIALEKPLVMCGQEYWYLDLTLVDMPGNVGGVARYSTGYALGKHDTPRLVLTSGTSIKDITYQPTGSGDEREPLREHTVLMNLAFHPRDKKLGSASVRIVMKGQVRRLIYWPDQGAFKVYEDYLEFHCTHVESGTTVTGYGTRQSGFRVGAFDPSLGGCG
jgi:hypothetical protein